MSPRKKSEFDYVMSASSELGKFVDKWIAVVDDKIIASDSNISNVYRKAKEHSDKIPFIMKVPSDKVMVL